MNDLEASVHLEWTVANLRIVQGCICRHGYLKAFHTSAQSTHCNDAAELWEIDAY
jgi:hypothetical protein